MKALRLKTTYWQPRFKLNALANFTTREVSYWSCSDATQTHRSDLTRNARWRA